MLSFWKLLVVTLPVLVQGVEVKISDVSGPAFRSPYENKTVTVTGLVTAKGPSGFWLLGEPSENKRASNGLSVYTTSATILGNVTVGSVVSLTGRIQAYRSSTRPDDLFLTELASPTNITTLSQNNVVTPIVLGRDRSPPTERLSALDDGPDGFLSIPNAVDLVATQNQTLQPELYGLDFWQSLSGQLVTVPSPIALNFENQYQEFWVRGAWKATGVNKRGGLTITASKEVDANPEVVMIGSPLDRTKNPDTVAGATLSDITGVVAYQFGFYYILPLTAPKILTRPDPNAPVTTLTSPDKGSILKNFLNRCIYTFGDYNVENLTPTSKHLPSIADHIGKFLKTPDLVFLQEIQDNNGNVNDGTVSANVTLSTLAGAVKNITGVQYSFVEIAPVNNQDGGEPGGNIRNAYFWRPERLSLVKRTPGGSLDAVKVEKEGLIFKKPKLSLNPGRIQPDNVAWNASRKPLVAEWKTPWGDKLFTINVHGTSKGGSGSTQGNSRPPMNGGVTQRVQQIQLISDFVKSIYDVDKSANVIVSGDFNEFAQARTVFAPIQAVMKEVDEAANIPPVERYTYIFDQNHQQLDHMFVSHAIAKRKVEVDHVHVNNWSPSYEARISDHDPSVARLRLCDTLLPLSSRSQFVM